MHDYYLAVISGKKQGILADFLRAILRVFSWIYQAVVVLMRSLYRAGILKSYRLGRPVISIGNITWGGVGKTPLVQWLAGYLVAKGKRPVILTRGYMPKKSGRKSDAPIQSDEAALLRNALNGVPVVVNPNRMQGALEVPRGYAHDVFVLDDGFQHWRVQRDLDIVAIDATNPFGPGFVLPRGSLREPLQALRQADIFVITKSDLAKGEVVAIRQTLHKINPNAVIAHAVHQPVNLTELRTGEDRPLDYLNGRRVVLASAIGDPQSFSKMVRGLGAKIEEQMVYPDHFCYGETDARRLNEKALRHDGCDIVITGKDAVKLSVCGKFFSNDIRVWVLNINLSVVQDEDKIINRIDSVFSA